MNGDWHFIISFTWSMSPNHHISSEVEGLTSVAPTRQQTFREIVAMVKRIKNIPPEAVFTTTFFALERNDFGVGGDQR